MTLNHPDNNYIKHMLGKIHLHNMIFYHMNKADKCGEWSLTSGYWDYCIYQDSAKPEYVSKTWEEKTDEIMTKVNAEQSTGTFPSTASNFYSKYLVA